MDCDELEIETAPLVPIEQHATPAHRPLYRPKIVMTCLVFVVFGTALWGYCEVHQQVQTKSARNRPQQVNIFEREAAERFAISSDLIKRFTISGDITNNGASQVLGNNNRATVSKTNNKYKKVIKGKRCEGSGNSFGRGDHGGAAQVVCCYGKNVQCCGVASAVSTTADSVHAAEKGSAGHGSQVKVATGCSPSPSRELESDVTLGDHASIVNNGGLQQIGNNNVAITKKKSRLGTN